MASPLSDILPSVSDALNLPQKTRELAVFSLWKKVVQGSSFESSTRPVRIVEKKGQSVLQISVNSGLVASQLSFQLDSFKEKLNQYAPQTGFYLQQIEVLVHR
jgi:hypothetical protein